MCGHAVCRLKQGETNHEFRSSNLTNSELGTGLDVACIFRVLKSRLSSGADVAFGEAADECYVHRQLHQICRKCAVLARCRSVPAGF